MFRIAHQTSRPSLRSAWWQRGGVLRLTTSSGFWIERLDARWRVASPPIDSDRADGDALFAPSSDQQAALRLEPSGEIVVWRFEPDTPVHTPDKVVPLGAWADGDFALIAAARMASGALRLVDRGGGVIDVDAAGVHHGRVRGSLRRQLRHTYPDPDPDEVSDACFYALIAATGEVWTLRASGLVERALPEMRDELARDREFRALALDSDGNVWAITDRNVRAIAGPARGERFEVPTPMLVGSAGVDRLIESIGDARRTFSHALAETRDATLGGSAVVLDDLVTHEGRTWRVMGQSGSIIAHAEHEASTTVYADDETACPRGLVSTGTDVFFLTDTKVFRWTGAAFVPSAPIGDGLRTLEATSTHVLVTSAETAWWAEIPPLAPAIDAASADDLRMLERRFAGLICTLRVARCVLDPEHDVELALRKLRVPRGTKRSVSALGAATAIHALWQGSNDGGGFTYEDSAELAGAFARGWGAYTDVCVLSDAETPIRAVIVIRKSDVIVTWVEHPLWGARRHEP